MLPSRHPASGEEVEIQDCSQDLTDFQEARSSLDLHTHDNDSMSPSNHPASGNETQEQQELPGASPDLQDMQTQNKDSTLPPIRSSSDSDEEKRAPGMLWAPR